MKFKKFPIFFFKITSHISSMAHQLLESSESSATNRAELEPVQESVSKVDLNFF